MKTINETFSDQEYKELIKIKGKMSWREFILLLRYYEPNEETLQGGVDNE